MARIRDMGQMQKMSIAKAQVKDNRGLDWGELGRIGDKDSYSGYGLEVELQEFLATSHYLK